MTETVARGRLRVLIAIHPRRLLQVGGLAFLLLLGAALAPTSIAAPNAQPSLGGALDTEGARRSWAELLARIVPEPSKRPLPSARFAQTRVVSLYGFPGVPVMGALGEGTPEEAAARVAALVRTHQESARGGRVVGALHLIVGVAEVTPGPDGSYLDRLDPAVIERYLTVARANDLLLFLDIQVGWADPLAEVQRLERFLVDPDVQIALDPEFATRAYGVAPGKTIGTLEARDVNRVQHYLAGLAREHRLPPKMLVLHQFLDSMLADPTHYDAVPEVEISIDMDGYGGSGSKLENYERFSLARYSERPAIKLFYRWDVPVITPEQLSSLDVVPGLVVYQ